MKRSGQSAEARIVRAKTILLIGQPFYGSLICNLALVEDNDMVPTMGTDGVTIFWNRNFVNECTDANLVFVLAHEVSHCAHLHHVRRNGRDPQGWNIAADYAINLDLTDGKIGVPPKEALINTAYRNWSAERIFAALPKRPKGPGGQGPTGEGPTRPGDFPGGGGGEGPEGDKPGGGGGTHAGDPGKCGGVLDGGKTPEQLRKQERQWQQYVRQALNNAVRSGGAGAVPGSMREVLKRLKGGGEDWRHVLRNFVDPCSRVDYSWSRPDRRFIGMPFILPGTVPNGVNHIVVAVDTSGSIDSDKCACFLRECQALLDQEFIDKLTVMQCDTSITDVAEYQPGDIVPTNVKGRGGTHFSPVWDWCKNANEDISALVYFTDLEPNGGDFGKEPSVPVLWACQNEDTRRKPPFGDLTVIGS